MPWHDVEPLPAGQRRGGACRWFAIGDADYACVPIENSIEGSVLPTLDSLATGTPLQVFAELTLDIAFTIAVRTGTPAPASIAAFPVAAAQVRAWLAKHLPKAQVQAGRLQRGGRRRRGRGPRRCRGNHRAGRRNATASTALATDVVDEPNARTRFVLAGPPGPPPARTGADRTSVVLRLDNVPGALASALTEFAIRDIDLTRIESRPTRKELGTYIFFLDCVGHVEDERSPRHSRRCTDVVQTCAIWVPGRRRGRPPRSTRRRGG